MTAQEDALRRGREALKALLGPGDPADPEKLPQDAAVDALVRLDLEARMLLAAACGDVLETLDGIGWEPDPDPRERWVRE